MCSTMIEFVSDCCLLLVESRVTNSRIDRVQSRIIAKEAYDQHKSSVYLQLLKALVEFIHLGRERTVAIIRVGNSAVGPYFLGVYASIHHNVVFRVGANLNKNM